MVLDVADVGGTGVDLLGFVFALFIVSLLYFGYCTLNQNCDAGEDGLWFVFGFYLVLPMLIFVITSSIIGIRCRSVAKKVDQAENRIKRALLRL